MIKGTRTRAGIALLTALLTAGIAAGCGDDDNGGTATSANLTATPDVNVALDKQVAAEVPSDVKSKGTLSVAADATYAPNEFIAEDGHTVIGMDPDLANALAQVMGLKAEVKNVTFDSIIPGLAAK